jgi:hypothetical protein
VSCSSVALLGRIGEEEGGSPAALLPLIELRG